MDAVNGIDFDLVEEAEARRAPKRSRLKWIAAAACAALVIGAGAFYLTGSESRRNPELPAHPGQTQAAEGRYRAAVSGETALIWPWEYLTPVERYTGMTLNGAHYGTRGREIREALLGDALGVCEASGYDVYTETRYPAEFAVRTIRGVDPALLVAVNLEGSWVVFLAADKQFPATWGELLDACSLPENLPLDCFCIQPGSQTEGWYRTDAGAEIWTLLSACRDAACVVDDHWLEVEHDRISFTVTSEALGAYKLGLSVSEDGCLVTNLMEYQYVFRIGPEAAGRIIRLAKERSTETEPEPYQHQIAGILTEIGNGYVRIDDTSLCVNEADGLVYRVLTDDLRIRRCLEFPGNIEIGDLVVVNYEGSIDASNTVTGAVSMQEAVLIDGGAAVPE